MSKLVHDTLNPNSNGLLPGFGQVEKGVSFKNSLNPARNIFEMTLLQCRCGNFVLCYMWKEDLKRSASS